jgi:hypothetical protein
VHALVHAGLANYEVVVAPATVTGLLIHLRLCRYLDAINLNKTPYSVGEEIEAHCSDNPWSPRERKKEIPDRITIYVR